MNRRKSHEADKRVVPRAPPSLVQGLWDEIARFNAAADGLPDGTTAFEVIAKAEGWTEEEIQKRRALMGIEELLGAGNNAFLRAKAMHYAALALGLEAPPLPPEGEGETKAQAVRVVKIFLDMWLHEKNRPTESEQSSKLREQRVSRWMIEGLETVDPLFYRLHKGTYTLKVLRSANVRTAPYAVLQKLAEHARVWGGETTADSLKKAWQRYR